MDNYGIMIQQMKQKYKDNPYILQKLHQYLEHIPDYLKNVEIDYTKRNAKKDEQLKQTTLFVEYFFQYNEYYYISSTEFFIEYKDKVYSIVSEDEIHNKIHHELSKQPFYMRQWKYKIKNIILKQIKDTPFNQCIPDTITIQTTLKSFYPSVFQNKNHLKYFLTIVGDTLLKKDTHLIHIIEQSYKRLLKTMSDYIYKYVGKSITETFKYKYYDHNYSDCRLFPSIQFMDEHCTIIRDNIINITAISYYYSNRFKSSDHFLNSCNDKLYTDQTYLLSTFSPQSVVEKFISELFIKDNSVCDNSLSYKDVYFLWRVFLKKYKLPCISSQTNFKSILSSMNILNIDNDTCTGIQSNAPITWNTFQSFWLQTISVGDEIDDELEIDEITTLYNIWISNKDYKEQQLTEEYLLEIMSWMMPEIIIDNERTIYNISCKLWNKKQIIIDYITHIPSNITTPLDKYKYYVNENGKSHSITANKQYFEQISNSIEI
tara:strand:- start:3058 stop:4521 length:1464 start_codon:yes stop_codon:yes gene_type:complete